MRENIDYLGRHDFGVGTRDVDTRIKTSSIMCFDDVTSIYLVGTNSAIVGSLWSWESILWPAKWMIILGQQGIFLFDTEPGLLGFASLYEIYDFITLKLNNRG